MFASLSMQSFPLLALKLLQDSVLMKGMMEKDPRYAEGTNHPSEPEVCWMQKSFQPDCEC